MDTPDPPYARDELQRAHTALQALPVQGRALTQATLVCPLCGDRAPVRGLRPARTAVPDGASSWEVVFTCPACGLITPFQAAGIDLPQLVARPGSPWTAELRRYMPEIPAALRHTRRAGLPQFVVTFLIAFITWLMLTATLAPADLLWGVAAGLVVAGVAYRYAAPNLPLRLFAPARLRAMLALLGEFTWQLIVQNLTLTWRVFQPDIPIRPGIVAVPTALTDDVQLTLLGSLTSLTPDTVTLDFDQARGILYVHWIDVRATDPLEIRDLLTAALEDKITRWLGR